MDKCYIMFEIHFFLELVLIKFGTLVPSVNVELFLNNNMVIVVKRKGSFLKRLRGEFLTIGHLYPTRDNLINAVKEMGKESMLNWNDK